MSVLMLLADQVLNSEINDRGERKPGILNDDNTISQSYNSQTAALGVTIATNGLLPALVIYYQDRAQKVASKEILEAIGKMISKDQFFLNNVKLSNGTGMIVGAKSLLEAVLKNPENSLLKQEVLDCAVALKQIIRTYPLKEEK